MYDPHKNLKQARSLAETAVAQLPKDLINLTGEQACKSAQDLHAASELLLEIYKKTLRG